jgi:U1 small nuclear ribonucleoprotein
MTSQLPPNLLRLFAPRPPLYYLPPTDLDPVKRPRPKYSGLAGVLDSCKDYDLEYKGTETMASRSKRLVVNN